MSNGFVRTSIPNHYHRFFPEETIYPLDNLAPQIFEPYDFHKTIKLNEAPEHIKLDINNSNVLNLLDKKIKLFWSKKSGPYNTVYMGFAQIFQAFRDYKNIKIYIDEGGFPEIYNNELYDKFLYRFLDDLGIEYQNFNPQEYKYILADNAIFPGWLDPSIETAEELYNVYKKYFDYVENPNKKAYISRKNYHDRYYGNIIGIPYTEDVRMYDDEILEDYLSSKGFDIITPEHDFKTYEEQMGYFAQVKTLMAVSCSGISNSFYMKPNGNIFELLTSFIVRDFGNMEIHPDLPDPRLLFRPGSEMIHPIYHTMSYIKHHNYFAMPNYTRKAQDIVNRIDSNPIFRKIIDEQ